MTCFTNARNLACSLLVILVAISASIPFSALSATSALVFTVSLPSTAIADDDDGDEGGGGGSSASQGRGGDRESSTLSRGRKSPLDLFRGSLFKRNTVRQRVRSNAAPRPATQAIVASGLTQTQLDALESAGFIIEAERVLELVPGILVRLRPPRGLNVTQSLELLQQLAPGASSDREHQFDLFFRTSTGKGTGRPLRHPLEMLAWAPDSACDQPAIVAIIDTAVDPQHPELAGIALEQVSVRSEKLKPSAKEHGTAIAAVLASTITPENRPGTRILAIDAFHRANRSDQANTFDLVAALDVAFRARIKVVNMSLTGPADVVLDSAGKAAESGMVIVAAAGNGGPNAEAAYPAAYPWAIAVTAIDDQLSRYRHANQGDYIDFAAPGVRLPIVDHRGRMRARSGTSFAATYISAVLAGFSDRLRLKDSASAEAALAASVNDLGDTGRDPVYGHGIPDLKKLCELSAVGE